MGKFEYEELAEILSRSRHPIRWDYAATSNIQDEDYVQADAVLTWLRIVKAEVWDEAYQTGAVETLMFPVSPPTENPYRG